MFVDCHCHLNQNALLEKNVLYIHNATHLNDIPFVLKHLNHPQVFGAIGIHPWNVSRHLNLKKMADNIFNYSKILALGEIGLDYSLQYKKTKELQIEVLKKQLSLSCDFKLPVILHCVKASNDLLTLLKQYKTFGILHGFSGSLEEAQIFIQQGFKIGFNANILKENFKKIRCLAKKIPVDSIVLESDFPYASQLNDLPKILKEIVLLRNDYLNQKNSLNNLKKQILNNTCEAFCFDFFQFSTVNI